MLLPKAFFGFEQMAVLRLGYFLLFLTFGLMTWAYMVRADAFPFLSSGPLMAKGQLGTVLDDYPPCSFNPLCTCSNPGPTDFGIVSCHSVPFGHLPSTLKISRAFVLSMVGNGLTVLENKQLTGAALWRLEVRENRLSSIGDESLIGLEKSLWELDFQNNELTQIPTKALRRLVKLRLLNLSWNKITDVQLEDFQGLQGSLTCLSLAGNMLVNIPEAAFGNLPKLERLDLSGNSLQTIDSGAFIGNTAALTHLHLSSNLLFKIPFDTLSPLTLTLLDLSHNLISSTYDSLFYQAKISVEDLLLTHNRISVLEPFSLQNFKGVESLSLSSNPIGLVDEDAFKESRLQDLDLSSCFINNINPKAFHGLETSLETLDLSFNNLSILPLELFEGFEQLRTLNLDESAIILMPNQLENLRYTLQKLSLIGDRSSPITLDEVRVMRNLRNLNISSVSGVDAMSEEVFEGFGPAIDQIKVSRGQLNAIKNQAFLHVPGLKSLDLSSNYITRIDNDAFQHVGHSLVKLKLNDALRMTMISPRVSERLTALKELDLSGNGLSSVPDDSFLRNDQITFLNLRFNKLNSLSQHLFEPLIRLTRVYLSFNVIGSLAESTFSRLKDLELVEFSDNVLKNLESRCFVDLTNLRILNLAGNQLQELKDETFQNLPKLQMLDLSYNKLVSFNIEAFEQLGTLSHFTIDLSHNRIQRLVPASHSDVGITGKSSGVEEILSGGVVIDVRSLERERVHTQDPAPLSSSSIERIDLSSNNISYISPHFFSPIGNTLLELDLSKNRLQNLSLAHLDGMRFLQTLHLESNRLETIDYETFRESKSIQMIFLDNNQLRDITPDLFENCTSLRVISCRNNKVRALSDSIFKDTPLEFLSMENNLLSRFPEAVLGRVAKTLVHLDLSGNDISSVNSIQVEALTQLRWLSLARNRIVVIADETFDSLSGLLHLDISGNALAKVTVRWFEEIKTSLLHLHLSNISLESLPDFDNFSNLLTFNSSDNQLTYLPTNFGVNVSTLRVLDISNNLIPAFPFTLWHTIPRLTQLIMNLNPIRVLSNDSFILMEHLHELDVSELPLEVVQIGVFSSIGCLEKLTMGPFPPSLNPGAIIQYVDSLQFLHLKLDTVRMISELQGGPLPSKLGNITLSGHDLLSIAPGALRTLQSRSLRLSIENTGLVEIPQGLLQQLGSVTSLSLIVPGNNSLLTAVGNPNKEYRPEPFVPFLDSLYLSKDIRLTCDCEIGWIEFWLRYWMDKTCPISSSNPKADSGKCNVMLESLRDVPCRDRLDKSIVEAFVTDLDCGWESSASLPRNSQHLILLGSLFVIVIVNLICPAN